MSKSQGIEYSIYTFDPSDPKKGGRSNTWLKRDTKTEINDALSIAEKLFKTGKYQKVEVKQKYFDQKSDRNIDTTLKVFEGRKRLEINVAMIFAFAVFCGAVAFGATYMIIG